MIERRISISPAYGRDYKNKAAAVADFLAGKDFMIEDISMPRLPCGISDFKPGVTVQIRFNKMRNVAIVAVPHLTGV